MRSNLMSIKVCEIFESINDGVVRVCKYFCNV